MISGQCQRLAEEGFPIAVVNGHPARKKRIGDGHPRKLASVMGVPLAACRAMLLRASGKANALRTTLKFESERSPDVPRLANALSALYPQDGGEKRELDAMLHEMPR